MYQETGGASQIEQGWKNQQYFSNIKTKNDKH